MATYKTVNVSETGDTGFKPPIGGMVFTRYAKFTLTAALAAGDILQMVDVYKDETVLGVICKSPDIDTATNVTFDIGDGGDADYFIDGSTIGQAGGTVSSLADDVAPKKYTANDTIDIKIATGPTTATSGDIEIWVVIA